MSKRLTTFKITASLKCLEMLILEKTELPKTLFQRRAIQDFLAGDRVVSDRLKIRSTKDPQYIKKDVMETIYLDADLEKEIKKVEKEQNCGLTQVLFQALLNYCVKCSDLIDEETLNSIIMENQK